MQTKYTPRGADASTTASLCQQRATLESSSNRRHPLTRADLQQGDLVLWTSFATHVAVVANDAATKVELLDTQLRVSIRAGSLDRVLDDYRLVGVDVDGWTHLYHEPSGTVRMWKWEIEAREEDANDGLEVSHSDIPRFIRWVDTRRGWELLSTWAANLIDGEGSDA